MSIIDRTQLDHDLRDVPTDARLQGLSTLLDVEQVRQILNSHVSDIPADIESCRVTYIRYKPATNCIIAYSARYRRNDNSAELLFYGKCYTKEDYLQAAQKTDDLVPDKSEYENTVISVPEFYSIFYLFPNDTVLDGLETVFDSRKLVRLLYDYYTEFPRSSWRISDKKLRTTVVRYKPEKRAVIRIDTRARKRENSQRRNICLFARTYSDESGIAIFKRMKYLAEVFQENSKIEVPRVLGYIPEKRLLLVKSVTGIPLSEQLESADKLKMVKEAAVALAELHKVGKHILPKRSASIAFFDGQATKETLCGISTEFFNQAEQIMFGLKDLKHERANCNKGFVHGDFHCGQVLIQTEGTVLLDFDRSYFGETMADIGNFCAHLKYLEVTNRMRDIGELSEAFVDEYLSVSDENFDSERLKLWTALGLLQFSVLPFRCFENNWRVKTLSILKECQELL